MVKKCFTFLFAVATGDISLVKEYAQNYMKPDASGNEKNGILSRDPLQNTKDHFVIFTALITRLCVEYGMIREEAYTISDLYINKMDVCNNSQKILYLQGEMLLDFTMRMAALEKKANYPIPIAQAIDYINNHLQEPLSLNKIASILGLTPSYLSYLFKKETGSIIIRLIQSLYTIPRKPYSQLFCTWREANPSGMASLRGV